MDLIWKKLVLLIPVLENSLEEPAPNNGQLELVYDELKNLNLLEEIVRNIYLEINNTLIYKVAPDFWRPFSEIHEDKKSKTLDKCGFQMFRLSVFSLHQQYEILSKNYKRAKFLQLKAELLSKMTFDFDTTFKAALLSQLPNKFTEIVYSFYHISFKVFINARQDDEEETDDYMELLEEKTECSGCGFLDAKCQCQELVNAFTQTNLFLNKMGLLDRIAGYTLTDLIQDQITIHIQEKCRGNFDSSHIKSLDSFLETIVLEWLTRIYNNGSSNLELGTVKIVESVAYFKQKMRYFLYEKYANIVIDQFFNIIIEFPDSQPAIEDLKKCMEMLDLRSHLVKTLKNSIETRLLHPGVDTSDIITGYVATIKTMRHLEKSGILLQTVTEPVKEYLRKRQDTVRCVITSLIEETPTDLSEELARSEAIKAEETANNQDEMNNWESWMPDPIDADPEKHTQQSRKSDIISMIVDIYGSKELFVNEYRNLLAERLLTQLDFNPEKEIRNLELLKLRFGETLLHCCAVMLKDISDSKRINTHIQSAALKNATDEEEVPNVSAIIVSSQFWPQFRKETMEFPEEIKQVFEKYKKSYEEYKGNRTLYWMPLNGKVNIEIELNDKKMDMFVTPAQATIIMHFQEQKEWQLDNLSSIMNMPKNVVRRRIGFWQLQGLIRETKENLFVLCDDKKTEEEALESRKNVICEEEECCMASPTDQREEELQVFWSYILGMLTNLDSMPLERIHQMLKMFASQAPGFEFSQDELRSFLQKRVREHKLIYAYGVYQLPKP